MIAALITLTVAVAPLVEVPEPGAGRVSIQVVVGLPELNPRERGVAAVLAEIILDDNAAYGRLQMRSLGALVGEMPRVSAGPDHFRIDMGVLPEHLPNALSYFATAMRSPRLDKASMSRAIEDLRYRQPDLWRAAIVRSPVEWRMRPEEVAEMHRRLFRPENVRVAVGGTFRDGEPTELWEARVRGWQGDRRPVRRLDSAPPAAPPAPAGRTVVAELACPPFLGTDAGFSTRFLATFALGCGKGSTVFEALREQEGLAYLHEAFLWPTPDGFRLRVLAAVSGDPTPEALPKRIRAALLEHVRRWEEPDRVRALALAEAVLLRELPLMPLYVSRGGPPRASLSDRTFLHAYWPMKTGQQWNPESLAASMHTVNLEDLKATAIGMLEPSIGRLSGL